MKVVDFSAETYRLPSTVFLVWFLCTAL